MTCVCKFRVNNKVDRFTRQWRLFLISPKGSYDYFKVSGFNALESTGPAVVVGERLGEGLADDVACLVGIKEFGVKRNDFNCEGGALGR